MNNSVPFCSKWQASGRRAPLTTSGAPGFVKEELTEAWTNAKAPLRKARDWAFTIEDFDRLTYKELVSLGFCRWDSKHWLIPLVYFNYIKDGEVLISISGREAVKGKNPIDLDVRGGILAYGWMRNNDG
jgi:hypothetical protein